LRFSLRLRAFAVNFTQTFSWILYTSFIKPLFDRVVSFLALIVASPVVVIVILLLAIANKGKIWFTQKRPGRNGKVFTVIKFKTMTDDRDANGNLLSDEQRLTPVGKFVRKTSIDEIPQLFNVLLGHMSFVGPRPLLMEYLPLYSPDQMRRHQVRPGITGWAQVNGRNTLSWQQKFAYDIWYVDNISFALDIKILFLTVIKVFKAEGISSESSLTMEKFRGNG
jgi:undecaprenyl phosphate N,N'-diacetylbacillosamine 1-phosphate transferase